jgi:pimeloyl-ACP methyl ester carboxylesterase
VTVAGDLGYDRHPTRNCDEWLMRIGAPEARPVLFLPPLFEEMNRTRALLAASMRALSQRGYCCWLPDLPGTGESERALDEIGWDDWREAARDAAAAVALTAGRSPAVASLRGGALLDDAIETDCRWRFVPADGASLSRDLLRASLVAPHERAPGLDLAGYRLGEALLDAVAQAVPAPLEPLRVVLLASNRGDADLKLDGPALWRRSEPASSPELAAALADDLAAWIAQCDAS